MLVSSVKVHGGKLEKYSVWSEASTTYMSVNVFSPKKRDGNDVKMSVLIWLSGLTCTEDNFMQKAGVFKAATEHQVVIVAPDTSPRDVKIEGMSDSWDFGLGAGFYVDATTPKWAPFQMHTFVSVELTAFVASAFKDSVDTVRLGIFGHSMGGHGALMIALRNPLVFKSVSALAPICNPIKCQWGRKAFSGYLGPNEADWEKYDSRKLAELSRDRPLRILIDQGGADQFLKDGQLLPENFVRAASKNDKISLEYRLHAGYDHSYYFICSFIEEHVAFHAEQLARYIKP